MSTHFPNANNCTASEIGKVNEFGYSKVMRQHPIDDLLQKMIDLLQVTNVTANVNYLQPNNITRLHFDIMTSFLQEHKDLSRSFDPNITAGNETQADLLVALNDWEDGHVFQNGDRAMGRMAQG